MSTTDSEAVHGYVHGRVQGVSYRASMKLEARRLGITGWVRNRDDGTVEFLAQGEAEAVEHLLAWARKGPLNARVNGVDVQATERDPTRTAFEIRY